VGILCGGISVRQNMDRTQSPDGAGCAGLPIPGNVASLTGTDCADSSLPLETLQLQTPSRVQQAQWQMPSPLLVQLQKQVCAFA